MLIITCGRITSFRSVLKLDILTSLSYKENTQAILKELQIYLKDTNEKFVCAAVRMVGQIADADPAVSGACMEGVMHLLLCSKAPALASECVVVLRQLLQQNIKSTTSLKILRQLAKLLIIENGMEEPIARSSIVWLIGEFHKVMSDVAPDILRILASGFADEFTETKMQIMNLAIKLSLQLPEDESVQLLMTYVLEMARYDVNTDLRDRSRFMTAMMGLAPSTESEEGAAESAVDEDALAELNEHAPGKLLIFPIILGSRKTLIFLVCLWLCLGIMLAPKLPPVTLLGAVDVEGIPNFTMGSLSSVVGHNVLGYEPLMAWLEVQPDPSIRDALRQTASDGSFDIEGSNNRGGRRGGGPGSGSDSEDNLRNFYNSSGGVAGGGAPRLSYSSSSSSSSASSRSSRSRVSSSGSGSEDDSDRSDENSNCSGRSSSSDTSSGSGSSSDDSSGGERRNARPHKKTSAGSNNHLPVPFVSAKPSPAPAARLVASSVSTVPASRSTGSCMEGLTAPTLAPQGSKGTVTMQGIRKVAPSKGKRDLLLTADTGSVLIDTGNHASSDDLVGLSATPQGGLEDFSAPATSSPFYDDMSAYDAPSLSGAQDSLLVPTLLAQPVTTMPPAPSLVTATASLGPGLNPGMVAPTAPASISTVALSSGYAGLMAPNNVGKPSAMMAHAPNAPSMHMPMAMSMIPPSGGGGLAGNQRMMMQQPLALTQHVQQAQAPGPSYGAPPSAGIGAIGSCEPCLQEGETLTAARVLLKPEMGGGLAVTIVFRNGVQAAAYSGAISAYIVLKNTRDQPIRYKCQRWY